MLRSYSREHRPKPRVSLAVISHLTLRSVPDFFSAVVIVKSSPFPMAGYWIFFFTIDGTYSTRPSAKLYS